VIGVQNPGQSTNSSLIDEFLVAKLLERKKKVLKVQLKQNYLLW
jgi:hypothetical protein